MARWATSYPRSTRFPQESASRYPPRIRAPGCSSPAQSSRARKCTAVDSSRPRTHRHTINSHAPPPVGRETQSTAAAYSPPNPARPHRDAGGPLFLPSPHGNDPPDAQDGNGRTVRRDKNTYAQTVARRCRDILRIASDTRGTSAQAVAPAQHTAHAQPHSQARRKAQSDPPARSPDAPASEVARARAVARNIPAPNAQHTRASVPGSPSARSCPYFLRHTRHTGIEIHHRTGVNSPAFPYLRCHSDWLRGLRSDTPAVPTSSCDFSRAIATNTEV